jgi:hypothetical protein
LVLCRAEHSRRDAASAKWEESERRELGSLRGKCEWRAPRRSERGVSGEAGEALSEGLPERL